MDFKNPKTLSEELKKTIIGQDDVIDKVCVFIFQYLLFKYSKYSNTPLQNKPNLLLMGSSGSGKTFIIKQLSQLLGFNFIEINGAAASQDGWSGQSTFDFIRDEIDTINTNPFNIVYIDEFDKFCTPQGATNTKNVSEHIQAELLKFIEASTLDLVVDKKVKTIDCDNICFIFSGNFQEVRESLVTPNTIGFLSENNNNNLLNKLKEFGVIPEILGRIPLVLTTNDLKEEQYRHILDNPRSYFKTSQELLAGLSIDLTLTEQEVDRIIEKTIKSGIGVRGLNSQIDIKIQDAILHNPEKMELVLDYFKYLHTSGVELRDVLTFIRTQKS